MAYWRIRIQPTFKEEAKKLKWATTKLCKIIQDDEADLESPESSEELYSSLKQCLGLLTDLWESILGQEEIQSNLGFDKKDWKENQLKIIQYLKTHNIKNNLIDRYDQKTEQDFQQELTNFELKVNSKIEFGFEDAEDRIMDVEEGLIAIKNKNSFLALGSCYCLVEKNKIIASGMLKRYTLEEHRDSYPDKKLIYSAKENAYFIILNYTIYRKDIDKRPPRLLMKLRYAYKRFIEYSEKYNLFLVNQTHNFVGINAKTSKLEFILLSQTTSKLKKGSLLLTSSSSSRTLLRSWC